MALLDLDIIRTGVIKSLVLMLKGQLAEIPTAITGVTRPAVIKDRSKGNRPSYPYCVVDYISTDKENEGWLIHQEINSDGVMEYTNEQNVMCTIYCYDNQDNAHTILNNFRSYLADSGVRTLINDLTQSTFQECSNTSDNPEFVNTDYIDGALMTINFVVRNTYTIPEGISPDFGYIEHIGYEYDIEGTTGKEVVDTSATNAIAVLQLVDRGTGYTTGAYKLKDTYSDSQGNGAEITITAVDAIGAIQSFDILHKGENYSSATYLGSNGYGEDQLIQVSLTSIQDDDFIMQGYGGDDLEVDGGNFDALVRILAVEDVNI